MFFHSLDYQLVEGNNPFFKQVPPVFLVNLHVFFTSRNIQFFINHLSVSKLKINTFKIGSVTKQFTAAAILRLIDEGKLSLEDDFTEYLNFDAKGRTVTINHLFNHTSGIPNYTELPEIENLSIQKTDYYKMTYFVY